MKKLIEKWDEFKLKHLSEHWNFGKNITVYGENGMAWAVNWRTKKFGHVCFRLPFRCFGEFKPLFLYCTPNGTPWASTFYRGKDSYEKQRAKLRHRKFGHNFDVDGNYDELRKINDSI